MGFGLLFFGYFVAYLGSFLSEFSVFTFILGAGIILFSLKNLVFENKMFVVSAVVSFILEVSAILVAILGFMFVPETSTSYVIISLVYKWITYVLNACLMIAIFVIAKEVDILKIKVMSIVNLIFISIGAIVAFAYDFISDEFTQLRLRYISVGSQILFVILGLFIIFNCYMKICYEDDQNMQRKSSGIPFFDFLNNKLDRAFEKKNGIGKKRGNNK
ncbi:MAG: hypothetical protein IJW54_03705 [Clostridia bacterium]|nr:hypothetical protein [Clostridia bacterium]